MFLWIGSFALVGGCQGSLGRWVVPFLVSRFSFLVFRFRFLVSRGTAGVKFVTIRFLDFAAALQIENLFLKSKGFEIQIPDLDRRFVKMIAIEHFCLHLVENGRFWSEMSSKCRLGQISRRFRWQYSPPRRVGFVAELGIAVGRDFSPKKMFLSWRGGNCCRFFPVGWTIGGTQAECQDPAYLTRSGHWGLIRPCDLDLSLSRAVEHPSRCSYGAGSRLRNRHGAGLQS